MVRAQELRIRFLQMLFNFFETSWQVIRDVLDEIVVLFLVDVQYWYRESCDLLKPIVLRVDPGVDLVGQHWVGGAGVKDGAVFARVFFAEKSGDRVSLTHDLTIFKLQGWDLAKSATVLRLVGYEIFKSDIYIIHHVTSQVEVTDNHPREKSPSVRLEVVKIHVER